MTGRCTRPTTAAACRFGSSGRRGIDGCDSVSWRTGDARVDGGAHRRYNRAMRTHALVLLALAACGGGGSKPAPVTPDDPISDDSPSTPPTGELAIPSEFRTVDPPPVAEPKVVTDTYHGVKVDDPYQWLEGDSAAVRDWSDGQDKFARSHLDRLPGLATLTEEIRAYIAAPITRYGGFEPAGGKLFAWRKLPTKEQRELVVMDSPEKAADARLVLDTTAGGDKTASFDWFVPSPDGTKVAVSISTGGSEAGDIHILDLDGKEVDVVIPNVQRGTGGGDVAWTPDGKGLYYTRYPAPGEKPEQERDFWMQLWFHRLGTPLAEDRYEMGKELPKIAEIQVEVHENGNALVTVQNGDGGTFQHYLRDKKGWRRLTDWPDQVTTMRFGASGDLWFVSNKGAPRGKLMRMAPTAKLAAAKVVVKEGPDVIVSSFADQDGPVITKDRVYLSYQLGGPDTIRAFTLTGKPAKSPTLPDVASSYLIPEPIDAAGDHLVWADSYVVPGAWYRYTPATGALVTVEAISPKPPVSLDGWEVHREMATSKDGTKIPVNIVWKAGAPRDGSVPCVVTGYGGYGISLQPGFAGGAYPLLKRGVCFAVVNLRGGGEFGKEWHKAGALTNKQNVFDDFAAALDHMVAQKYTSPARLAIQGGSNGGLLMGALITQHPEKVKAVVSQVGIYDMLRVELSPNGLYNTTEFGTVTEQGQFRALHAYSPYHHIVKGTKYPAILMTTGANDPRVAPWHSRKFTAALQAAQGGDAPILLRTSSTSGHGAGTAMTERIATQAHVMAFVMSQLGVTVE
jgi:prolyl oligopeptidase